MDTKKNQIMLGLIVCAVGFFTIFSGQLRLELGNIIVLGSGAACLLLYITKKKSLALIVGAYLSYVGLYNLLGWWLGGISANFFAAMFFIVPGLIFFVLFFDKNKYGLIIPAAILFWFGLFVFLTGIPLLNNIGGTLFFLAMALAFLTIRLMGDYGRWPGITAFSLFCIGGLTLLRAFSMLTGGWLRPVIAVVVILLGVGIIFSSFKK